MDDDSLNAVGSHCPTCGQEYRPGFTVCADDGTELVPGPAPATGNEPDDGLDEEGSERTDLADLTSDLGPPAELGTYPLMDAVLLAGRLRSVGIPAVSESDVSDAPYRVVGDTSRVFVRPEDLGRARSEVERIEAGADADAGDDFEETGEVAADGDER